MERESDLYAPVKALLETQGYTVKGEVGAADLVALRGDEPPVIVELKLRITLSLYHQACARLSVSDHVYIAVPRPTGRSARRAVSPHLLMMVSGIAAGAPSASSTVARRLCSQQPRPTALRR